jgi:hypothetical protein
MIHLHTHGFFNGFGTGTRTQRQKPFTQELIIIEIKKAFFQKKKKKKPEEGIN